MTPQPKGRSSVVAEWDEKLCEIVVYHVTFLVDKKISPVGTDSALRVDSIRR